MQKKTDASPPLLLERFGPDGAPVSAAARAIMKLLLLLPCFLTHTVIDNDTWFLINNGRYVFQNGLPHTEPFTLHEKLQYIMQQWLSSVFFAGINDVLGPAALRLFTAVLTLFVVILIYRIARRLSGGNYIVTFAVTLVTGTLLSDFITLRPQVLSLLVFLGLALALEYYTDTQKPAALLLAPVLSALLVNLHAAMWPFFFVLMAPYIIDAFGFRVLFVKGQGYKKLPLITAFAASLAAGFLNPYGFEAMTYTLRSYGVSSINSLVSEMHSPDFKNILGIFIFCVMLALVLIYSLRGGAQLRLRHVLITIGTAFMTLSSLRSTMLFIALSGAFLAFRFKDFRVPEAVRRERTRPAVVAVLLILILVSSGVYRWHTERQITEHRKWITPVGAVEYVLKNYKNKPMHLYMSYNTGGYGEYMGLRPFIDARAEVFLKSNNKRVDIFGDYVDMKNGSLYYKDFINKYRLTHFIVEKGCLLFNYLKRDGEYEIMYEDKYFAVIAVDYLK